MTDPSSPPSPPDDEMGALLQGHGAQPEGPTADTPPILTPPPSAGDDVLADDRPFDEVPGVRIGLLGGKGVGKSYLFQSIVYRVSGPNAAALAYYLRGCRAEIARTLQLSERARRIPIERVVADYCRWARLDTTRATEQAWYRLALQYRAGWPPWRRSRLDLSFFDGSGELLVAGIHNDRDRKWWKHAFLDAAVLVFCLPFWAVFPEPQAFGDGDSQRRDGFLSEFGNIATTFRGLWEQHGQPPIKTVLALTMADDRRCGVPEVKTRWIDPYLGGRHIARLKTGAGLVKYIGSARAVSEHLHARLVRHRDNRVARIPNNLEFGAGLPWILPMSAIDGAVLSTIERNGGGGAERHSPPVPVHVELPLLLCLSLTDNALM